MIFWTIVNCTFSAVVAAMITYNLAHNADRISCPQRIGMAIIAAAMVMKIGPIIAHNGVPYGMEPNTPFDDWVSTLLRIGLVIYFGARVAAHAMSTDQR